jgi:hypothetical protein
MESFHYFQECVDAKDERWEGDISKAFFHNVMCYIQQTAFLRMMLELSGSVSWRLHFVLLLIAEEVSSWKSI